ncbi:MAG: hypothetical protein ACKVP9_20930, partial [Burkholderiales bacterium]
RLETALRRIVQDHSCGALGGTPPAPCRKADSSGKLQKQRRKNAGKEESGSHDSRTSTSQCMATAGQPYPSRVVLPVQLVFMRIRLLNPWGAQPRG